jgi:suppressor of fused-like protein
MSDQHTTDAGPGWDAIDSALRPLYGKTQPVHYGTVITWRLGGPDPLDGISVYKRTDGECHWHFISYGLTELYKKESRDAAVSGYGLELSFRLACRRDDSKPPAWAMSFLQNLARYIFQTGNVFEAGHHLNLNGPIAVKEPTEIGAILFAADPELPACDSPNGRFSFLQIVGITLDELEAVQYWNSARFTEVLASRSPLLVTDLQRQSVLAEAETARQVAAETEREGSSMGELYTSTVEWSQEDAPNKRTRIVVDALAARMFVRQLSGRLLHDRQLVLCGKGTEGQNLVAFRPAESPSITAEQGGLLVVALSRPVIDELREKFPAQRGLYRSEILDGFEIEVVPLEIKDAKGNVIRVEG